jgi:FkbM family methyltransferase
MLINFENIVRKYGKPKGILHVGANRGQEAEEYQKAGVNHVVWVEALKDVYADLVSNVSKYCHTCINACVSDVEGKKVVFHESNNEGQSSSYLQLGTHKTAHPEVHFLKDHEMTTTTIEELYINHSLDGLDMLVMDIQGAEMDALKGSVSRLPEFKIVYLEVNTQHVYEGCALLPEIDKFLRGYGFKKAEERIFKQWGWGDCLWTR